MTKNLRFSSEQKPVQVTARYSGGIGFCSALFLVFLVLKLTSVIDWSWWWITAPLWIPAAFGAVVLEIIIVLLALAYLSEKK